MRSGNDLRHSGVLALPQALRLAPSLQVSAVNSHDTYDMRGCMSNGPAGFDRPLVKPVDPAELTEVLGSLGQPATRSTVVAT